MRAMRLDASGRESLSLQQDAASDHAKSVWLRRAFDLRAPPTRCLLSSLSISFSDTRSFLSPTRSNQHNRKRTQESKVSDSAFLNRSLALRNLQPVERIFCPQSSYSYIVFPSHLPSSSPASIALLPRTFLAPRSHFSSRTYKVGESISCTTIAV